MMPKLASKIELTHVCPVSYNRYDVQPWDVPADVLGVHGEPHGSHAHSHRQHAENKSLKLTFGRKNFV
jgi:hypothetical protein